MGFRASLACNVTPLLLRLALGVTFVWAGWAKVNEERVYEAEALATLANMGSRGAIRAAGPGAGGAAGAPAEVRPAEPTPGAPARPEGPAAPLPEPGTGGGGEPGAPGALAAVVRAPAPAGGGPASAGRVYVASDFAQGASLARLHDVALLLASASKPRVGPDGAATRPALWPERWGRGPAPLWLARLAAWTELVGGGLVLAGLFTRVAALGLAVTMGVALWLTQIGPAVGAAGSFLGFLPALNGFAPGAWRDWLWQFGLLMSALGVFFSGAGAVSVDWLVFSGRRGGDEEEAEE